MGTKGRENTIEKEKIWRLRTITIAIIYAMVYVISVFVVFSKPSIIIALTVTVIQTLGGAIFIVSLVYYKMLREDRMREEEKPT
jgi:membrane protein YdbS with pleckstrin-like domain